MSARKKVYLTDKQAGSALFQTTMGIAAENAKLKKKLADREGRLKLLAQLLADPLDGLGGEPNRKVIFGESAKGDDVDILDFRRLLNLRCHPWTPGSGR